MLGSQDYLSQTSKQAVEVYFRMICNFELWFLGRRPPRWLWCTRQLPRQGPDSYCNLAFANRAKNIKARWYSRPFVYLVSHHLKSIPCLVIYLLKNKNPIRLNSSLGCSRGDRGLPGCSAGSLPWRPYWINN